MFSLRETMLCALAAAALAAAGCTERGLSTDPSLVRFTSSARDFETKATDVTLSDDDVVGIFASDPIAVGNARAVVSGKSIFPDKDMYWAEGQKVATRFSAYYQTVAGAVSFTLQVTDWEDADENPDFGGQETIVVKDKWSVIGKIMGSNWNKDFVMTDGQDNSWSIDITYAEGDQFKFRYDGNWVTQYGMWNNVEPFAEYKTIESSWIEATTDANPTYVLAAGTEEQPNCNIALPEAGSYTLKLVTFGADAGALYVTKK